MAARRRWSKAPLGRGRVLVLATTLDLFWNDLALKPVYLPFVHQLARQASSYAEQPGWTTVGQAVDVTTHRHRLGDPQSVRTTGDAAEGSSAMEVTEPGFYEVRDAREGQPLRVIASNVDLAESDLARVDPGEVSVAVTGQPGSGGLNGGPVVVPDTRPGAGTTNLVVPAVRRYPDPHRRIVAGAPAVAGPTLGRARYERIRARRTRCRHPAGAQAVADQAGDSRRGRVPRGRPAGHPRDRRGPRLLPVLAGRDLLVPHPHRPAPRGRGLLVLRPSADAAGQRRTGRALSRRARALARVHHPHRDGRARRSAPPRRC